MGRLPVNPYRWNRWIADASIERSGKVKIAIQNRRRIHRIKAERSQRVTPAIEHLRIDAACGRNDADAVSAFQGGRTNGLARDSHERSLNENFPTAD